MILLSLDSRNSRVYFSDCNEITVLKNLSFM